MRKKLHNNGSRYIWHNPNRKNRKPFQCATREHVEHVEDRSPLLIEQHLECNWIDARYRNEGTNPENHQRSKNEQKALLEFNRGTASGRHSGLQLSFCHGLYALDPTT